MKIITRVGLWVGALTLLGASFSAAESGQVSCYLVDSRIHVAVVEAGVDAGGQVAWRDTVTGESGEMPFTHEGNRLQLVKDEGAVSTARIVPHVAIVVHDPPWQHPASRPSLGVALN